MARRIKKGDMVVVIAGRDKGASGRVLKVLTDVNRVLVEGVNRVKRHQKPRSQTDPGGIVEKEAAVHVSNLLLVCPKCSKPSRTGFGWLSDGKKVRVCKSCKEMLA